MTIVLSLSIFSAFADELDPAPVEGIVVKVDEQTNETKVYKIETGLFSGEEFDIDQANLLAQNDLEGSEIIENIDLTGHPEASELDSEVSVGNFFFFNYNFNRFNRFNRFNGFNPYGFFSFNRFRFNYGYSYNFNSRFRYHFYY